MKPEIINTVLPADDLHWWDEEGGYCLLSKKEAKRLLSLCSGLTRKQMIAAFRAYETYKADRLLWKNFMGGRLSIHSIDTDGSPLFSPNAFSDGQ